MNTPNFLPPSLPTDILHSYRSANRSFSIQLAWNVGQRIVAAESDRGGVFPPTTYRQLAANLRAHGILLSADRLRQFRKLYTVFPDWSSCAPELSWTHYTQLLRISDTPTRNYYLEQAAQHHWSTRELQRQIRARTYERWSPAGTDGPVQTIAHLIRETYVLEFTELQSSPDFLERDLELALLDKLQYFLLELGSGFAFVGRQKRIFTETGKQFFVDLVFYHVHQKCYVLIDLKITELSHRDIGQMDMYVRLYDHKYRSSQDAPTVGIILCSEKDPSLVRYSMLRDSQQLFASTYILHLPQPDP